MNMETLFEVRNHWKDLARQMLDREKKGVSDLQIEFVEKVDVLSETIDVLISLEELKRVGESANYINGFKIIDSLVSAEQILQQKAPEKAPYSKIPYAIELFKAKVVHDREYIRTYAFWKAVEILNREGGKLM